MNARLQILRERLTVSASRGASGSQPVTYHGFKGDDIIEHFFYMGSGVLEKLAFNLMIVWVGEKIPDRRRGIAGRFIDDAFNQLLHDNRLVGVRSEALRKTDRMRTQAAGQGVHHLVVRSGDALVIAGRDEKAVSVIGARINQELNPSGTMS